MFTLALEWVLACITSVVALAPYTPALALVYPNPSLGTLSFRAEPSTNDREIIDRNVVVKY